MVYHWSLSLPNIQLLWSQERFKFPRWI